MNHALCWLALSKNRLGRIAGLQNLSALAVLDLSDNRIARIEGLEQLAGLKAFIAARNRIKRVEGISPKKNSLLETLILSNNQIAECRLGGFSSLKKLSLSHNRLHAFPHLTGLPALTELRLNHNRLCSVAPVVQQLPRLTILDVGGNLVTEAKGLEALRGLLWLKSLTVKGNAAAGDEALKDLLASLKRLEILDNARLTGEGKRRMPLKNREVPGGEAGAAAPGQQGSAGSGSQRRQLSGGARDDPRTTEKAAPAAPLAVNGLQFRGKKTAFASDSEEGEGAGRPPGAAPLAREVAPAAEARRKPRRKVRATGAAAKETAAKEAGTEETVSKQVPAEAREAAPAAEARRKPKRKARATGADARKTAAKEVVTEETVTKRTAVKKKVKRCPAAEPDARLDDTPGAAVARAPRKKKRAASSALERRRGEPAAAADGTGKRRPRSPEGVSSAGGPARPARKKRRARAP
ncbi:unnamed protein product [Prorocentrum cordatum]|uniref:Protein phosphatase 1 regulatory subunit 7 n=1 Tax=Prorocentrum cordatum TaxID=2364126 RepID=A0ABN9RQD1_9DINO|nr:unnamed protein product [Polarella glacialis]